MYEQTEMCGQRCVFADTREKMVGHADKDDAERTDGNIRTTMGHRDARTKMCAEKCADAQMERHT